MIGPDTVTVTERDYRKLLKALRAVERYTLIGIEKNARGDLPWTVTVEGGGHVKCYCTLGTYPEVQKKAQNLIRTLNSKRRWGNKAKEVD